MPWNKIGDLNKESILVSFSNITTITFSANKHFKLTHWDVAPLKNMSASAIINNQASPSIGRGQLK